MKCYKIVVVKGAEMNSYDSNSLWSLEYSIGITTKPRIGKIFAFKNKRNAIGFLKTIGYSSKNYKSFGRIFYTIIKGEGKKSKLQLQYACRYRRDIPTFWENPLESFGLTFQLPKGTILLDEFTPEFLDKKGWVY